MGNESVFEHLHRMRRTGLDMINLGGKSNQKDSEFDIIKNIDRDKEPSDDLGSRIQTEFYGKGSDLSDTESSLAIEYFSEDYRKSQNNAVRYLESAQRQEAGSSEWNGHLRKAGKLTSRAKFDVDMTMRISPEGTLVGVHYEIITQALGNFRDMLHLTWEFPDNYQQIIPIHLELKKAVKEEDYETASQLRDRIKELTSD